MELSSNSNNSDAQDNSLPKIRPTLDDFNHPPEVVDAHNYFVSNLPPSLGAAEIAYIGPRDEQLEKLERLKLERSVGVAEIAGDVVDTLLSNASNSSERIALADELGEAALSDKNLDKDTRRAMAVRTLVEPGNQDHTAERLLNLPAETRERLLNALGLVSSVEAVEEVERELDREKYIRVIQELGQEYKQAEDNEIKQKIVDGMTYSVGMLSTAEDQVEATREVVSSLMCEYDSFNDGISKDYSVNLNLADIYKDILANSEFGADIIANHASLIPQFEQSFLQRKWIGDSLDSLIEIKEDLRGDEFNALKDALTNIEVGFFPTVSNNGDSLKDPTPRSCEIINIFSKREHPKVLSYLSHLDKDSQADYLERISKKVTSTYEASMLGTDPHRRIDIEGIKVDNDKLETIIKSGGINGALLAYNFASNGIIDMSKFDASILVIDKIAETSRTESAFALAAVRDVVLKDYGPININKGQLGREEWVERDDNLDWQKDEIFKHVIDKQLYELILESNHPSGSGNIFKDSFSRLRISPCKVYSDYLKSVDTGNGQYINARLYPTTQIVSLYNPEDVNPELVGDYLRVSFSVADLGSVIDIIDELSDITSGSDKHGDYYGKNRPIRNGSNNLKPDDLIRYHEAFSRDDYHDVLVKSLVESGNIAKLNAFSYDGYEMFKHLKDSQELHSINLDAIENKNTSAREFYAVAAYLNYVRDNSNILDADNELGDRYREFLRKYKRAELVMSACGVTREGYDAIGALEQASEVPEFLTRLGVDKVGDKGIEQLKGIIREVTSKYQAVYYDTSTFNELLESPLLQSVLAKVYRLGEGAFASKKSSIGSMVESRVGSAIDVKDFGSIDFSEITEDRHPVFDVGEYRIKNRNYFKSGLEVTSEVKSIFESRAKEVLEYIDESDCIGILYDLSNLIIDLKEKSQDLLSSIDAGENEVYEALDDKRKQFYRNNEVNKLEALGAAEDAIVGGMNDGEQIFEALATLPETYPYVRRLISYEYVAGLDDLSRTKLIGNLETKDGLSISNLVAQKEMMEQCKSQGTFSDKKLRKTYNSIFNTKYLDDEIARIRKLEDDGEKATYFNYIPTRGAGLEFSGELSDVCWAGVYESIAKAKENVTAVIIKRNSPENPDHERLVGSFMLIETETEAGEKVLVIRGINPLENQTAKMDADDFVASVLDYTREQAAKIDAIPAVTYDGISNGATTNRPLISEVMDRIIGSFEMLKIPNSPKNEFNRYSLSNATYAI